MKTSLIPSRGRRVLGVLAAFAVACSAAEVRMVPGLWRTEGGGLTSDGRDGLVAGLIDRFHGEDGPRR